MAGIAGKKNNKIIFTYVKKIFGSVHQRLRPLDMINF